MSNDVPFLEVRDVLVYKIKKDSFLEFYLKQFLLNQNYFMFFR